MKYTYACITNSFIQRPCNLPLNVPMRRFCNGLRFVLDVLLFLLQMPGCHILKKGCPLGCPLVLYYTQLVRLFSFGVLTGCGFHRKTEQTVRQEEPVALMLCLALLFVLVFLLSDHLAWERERAAPCASRAFVYVFCTRLFLLFYSFAWCQRLATACDCGTLCTFLLTFSIKTVPFQNLFAYFESLHCNWDNSSAFPYLFSLKDRMAIISH